MEAIIMALPKKRHSKTRRDKRRTHWKLKSHILSKCSHCGSEMMPHRVCPNCGYYNGREILVEETSV
jgi:large subunit ribosomal protein L32